MDSNSLDSSSSESNAFGVGKQIESPDDIYNVLLQAWDENRLGIVPDAKLLYFDEAFRVTGIEHILSDKIPCFNLNPQDVIATALKAKAHSFILAQSNAFEMVTPTIFDFALAEKLIELGEQKDAQFADHFIISAKGYYSYALDEFHYRDAPDPS